MTYEVTWAAEALKALRRLSPQLRDRALAEAAALAQNPRPPRCRMLKGKPRGRWRVRFAGDWRLIYTIDDAVLVVEIIDVANRDTVYK